MFMAAFSPHFLQRMLYPPETTGINSISSPALIISSSVMSVPLRTVRYADRDRPFSFIAFHTGIFDRHLRFLLFNKNIAYELSI